MKRNKKWLLILTVITLLLTACQTQTAEKNGVEQGLGSYREKLADLTKMTGKAVFTDVGLQRATVMRGFGVDEENKAFYISQPYRDEPSDLILTKVESIDNTWQGTEWMHVWESGYGGLCFEKGKDGNPYLWMESNGTLEDVGSTISYVEWQNEAFLQTEYGQTFSFDETKYGNPSPQIDEENDWLVLRMTGGDDGTFYAFYDRSSLLNGEDAECIYKVSCASGQKASSGVDDSRGRYGTITCRGFAVGGGYIYQVHGNANGKIYITAFDLKGNLVYCHLVSEYEDLSYREPEGLAYVDGKIYLLLATGSSSDYLASVIVFE